MYLVFEDVHLQLYLLILVKYEQGIHAGLWEISSRIKYMYIANIQQVGVVTLGIFSSNIRN